MPQRPTSTPSPAGGSPIRGGTITPLGSRLHPSLVAQARQQLKDNPLWSHRTAAEQWICPYCLSAVGRRPGATLTDSILRHLDNCRVFAFGKGSPQPLDRVRERQAYENMVHRVRHDPAWQVFDDQGTWISPCSLDRVPSVQRRGNAADNFVFQAMFRHLNACPHHRRGIVHTHDEVQLACELHRRRTDIIAYLTYQIHHDSRWRQVDAQGMWICPYTLIHAEQIRPEQQGGWPMACERIAAHLITTCPRFALDQEPIHEAATIAQAAGPGAYVIPGPATPPPTAVDLARLLSNVPGRMRSPSGAGERTPSRAVPVVAEAATAETDDLGWMDRADVELGQAVSVPVPQQRADMVNARRLQEKILHRIPEIPGWRCSARFEACDEITGDFFVFVPLEDGRMVFALGDVSGHGVQAGLIMSMAKKTIEIYAAQGHGPAATLGQVNDALVGDLGGKMFISMVYAIIDPATASITWARAGHNPAMHFNTATGTVVEIQPPGMVVGMKAGSVFRDSLVEEVTPVAPGDTFCIYTDGITETMNVNNEEFGSENLAQIVAQYADDGPEALIDQIMDRRRHFRGSRPPADDATVVVLTCA